MNRNTPRPVGSLVASAKRLTSEKIQSAKVKGGGTASWQDDAWDMFDLVGEQRFLATNLAGQLAKAKLYVGRYTPGQDRPERLEDGEGEIAKALLESIGGTESARSQLLYRLAVNLFVPGEGWLVGIPPEDADTRTGDDLDGADGVMITQRIGEDGAPVDEPTMSHEDTIALEWRMLSVSEVKLNAQSGNVELSLDEGVTQEYSPDDLYMIRVWRPHPRRWWEADSPTRSSLPVLKELVGLTMHVSAQVDSRLAGAGILALPASVQRSLAQQAGVDPDEAGDHFTEALIEAMVTPISDRASASAVVPLVVTAADDAVDKIKHIQFSTPLDTAAQELREEAIRRLALGEDAPPELLLGTGDMNHWGGWLVQAETVTTHIEPVLALICDALTTQYLWPALAENGDADAEQYVVWYDVDDLIARPNLSTDALALHERGVISDDVLRRSMGFDDADAPKETAKAEDDPALAMVLDMIRSAPSLVQDPGIPVLVDQIRAVLNNTPAPAAPAAEAEATDQPAGKIPDTAADDAPPIGEPA